MKNITFLRKEDIIYYNEDLKDILAIKKFPMLMGCTTQDRKYDIEIDQVWGESSKSGVIQLSKLINLESLYEIQHDAGKIGDLWADHHLQFAKYISNNTKICSVLEIGGAHGILSINSVKYGFDKWTIIEPAPSPVEGCKAKFINKFFSSNLSLELPKTNLIVHSHVLEHIYDPISFLKNCNKTLNDNGKMIFSVPNIYEMVKRKYSNSINFEHTIFLTEEIILNLLSQTNFEIENIKYFKDDHSIFYTCKKTQKNFHNILKLPDNYKEIFLEYWNHFKQDSIKINEMIKNYDGKVYLFGAHIFSQILLCLGIDWKNISYILDNADSKIDKRLYGSELIVKNPNIIQIDEKPLVILRAGKYNEEISKQLKLINPSVQII